MRTVLVLAAALAAYGQSPTFEVASIKPYERPEGQTFMRMGCSGGPGSKDPVRWTCEAMGVVHLFQQAYDLRPYQVTGLDPIRSDRFNILAKVPQGVTREQFRQMQQNLLAERFGVRFHKEQKEMQGYELVVAKDGPKLTESGPEPEPGAAAPPPPNQPVTMGKDGFPEIPRGRTGSVSIGGPNGMVTQRVERGMMRGLAAMLSVQVERPVIDATGLTGRYDYTLKFVRPGMAGPGADASEPAGPTITTAIQEQLGLRLEAKKVVVELFVIDSVAKRPTEN